MILILENPLGFSFRDLSVSKTTSWKLGQKNPPASEKEWLLTSDWWKISWCDLQKTSSFRDVRRLHQKLTNLDVFLFLNGSWDTITSRSNLGTRVNQWNWGIWITKFSKSKVWTRTKSCHCLSLPSRPLRLPSGTCHTCSGAQTKMETPCFFLCFETSYLTLCCKKAYSNRVQKPM